MLTKLERAKRLRREALIQETHYRDHAADASLTPEFRRSLEDTADEYALAAEMYGDLIAKYEAMQEETI